MIGGRLAIHAAKRPVRLARLPYRFAVATRQAYGVNNWQGLYWPLGEVIATVRIAGVMPAEQVSDPDPFGDHSPGRFAWLLDDVVKFAPVPARGNQRLWEWSPEQCPIHRDHSGGEPCEANW